MDAMAASTRTDITEAALFAKDDRWTLAAFGCWAT